MIKTAKTANWKKNIFTLMLISSFHIYFFTQVQITLKFSIFFHNSIFLGEIFRKRMNEGERLQLSEHLRVIWFLRFDALSFLMHKWD